MRGGVWCTREVYLLRIHGLIVVLVFSGITVAISLSALLVFPQFFLRSFAYAGIATVALVLLFGNQAVADHADRRRGYARLLGLR